MCELGEIFVDMLAAIEVEEQKNPNTYAPMRSRLARLKRDVATVIVYCQLPGVPPEVLAKEVSEYLEEARLCGAEVAAESRRKVVGIDSHRVLLKAN